MDWVFLGFGQEHLDANQQFMLGNMVRFLDLFHLVLCELETEAHVHWW
jgi:hypothetical protein